MKSPAPDRVMIVAEPGQGHPVGGAYCEMFWLPVLGPTSYLLARRAATLTKPMTLPVRQWSAMLGVKDSTFVESSRRLHNFGCAHFEETNGTARLVVPVAWVSLSPSHARKLEPPMDKLFAQMERVGAVPAMAWRRAADR